MCILLFINHSARAQDLTINSDSFHYDNKTGIATYLGNVHATQKDRELTGDRLEIYRDEKTGKMDLIKIFGKPAKYQGSVEEGKPPVFAKANEITYHIPTKFLTLTGNAEVKQEDDIYRSHIIEYDGIKDTVYSPASKQGQTTIILKDINDAGI
ncbi:MAG: lipopolysaccharide transport periplasmic protein LptA [Legionellales bacterium]